MTQNVSINSPSIDEFLPNGKVFFPENMLEDMALKGLNSIDSAEVEFKNVYKERAPYKETPMLDGQCYKWHNIFIHGLQIAMTTDRLDHLTKDELEAWRYFVNFENYHSTSARENDANGTAIGCTVPNHNNESFVVAGDYAILDGKDGRKEELCQPPGYEIEGEQIWKSLDKVFMALYNCEEINDCTNSYIPEDVAPCVI